MGQRGELEEAHSFGKTHLFGHRIVFGNNGVRQENSAVGNSRDSSRQESYRMEAEIHRDVSFNNSDSTWRLSYLRFGSF